MSFESAKAIPRVHKAERLARGVKVVDTDPASNPGSTQGGAEWRVTQYQPERKQPLSDLNAVNATQPEECEEERNYTKLLKPMTYTSHRFATTV